VSRGNGDFSAGARHDAPLRTYAPAEPAPNFWLLLVTVSLGGVFAPLNSTMLAVALPDLRRDFDVGHAEVAWLVSAYLIAMAVAQPLGGRLGDQLGRANVFRAGLLAFLVLSLACAAAPTFPLLILLRTGQALVGAAVIPNGMAMLRESVPPDRLGRSGGFTGSAMSIAAATGPLLGAGILAIGSWRLLFLMNLPLVAAALIAFALLKYPAGHARSRLDLDWTGAGALAVLLVSVTFLLNALSGGQSAFVLAAAVVALAVFAWVFVRRQQSSVVPVVEWTLFRNRSYAAATGFILLGNLVMYTALLTIPFFIEEVQRAGSGRTGVLQSAIAMPMIFISPLAGRLSDSLGRRPLISAGSVLLVASTAALAFGIREGSSFPFLVVCLGLLGVGMSVSFGPVSAAAIESTPREMAGTAAGTNSMMRYFGSIVGTGLLGAILTTESGLPEIGLFRLIFAVLVVMSVLAALCAVLVHRFPARLREAPEPRPDGMMASRTATGAG
jgi:EmrB/QacA subfamily drug resistance transporter